MNIKLGTSVLCSWYHHDRSAKILISYTCDHDMFISQTKFLMKLTHVNFSGMERTSSNKPTNPILGLGISRFIHCYRGLARKTRSKVLFV